MELDLFEYGYLVEDTDPNATKMKVYIPKIMGGMAPSATPTKTSIDTNSLMNDGDSSGGEDVSVDNSVQTQNYIEAPVTLAYSHEHSFHNCPGNCVNVSHPCSCPGSSTLAPCPHFHHDHHFRHMDEKGKVPKGSRVICLIMNKNPKDVRVTRLCCDFPGEF